MRLFNIAVAVIALIGGVEVAWAEKRVALVIGNSSYQRVARLPNPNNDAADMAALLSKVGFKVSRKMDLDHTAFRKALQEFGREAEGADFAIIFFAGHGVEVENRNFLVPTDVSLSADSDVEFEAIPLDLVMNALSRVSGVRVVLLDACRDNPFIAAMRRSNATRSIGRGLAAIEPAARTLVGYAAKEGTTAFDGAGRNSPYTAGLLAHLGEPGVDHPIRVSQGSRHCSGRDRRQAGTIHVWIAAWQGNFHCPSSWRNGSLASQQQQPRCEPDGNRVVDLIRGSKSSGALKDYLQLYPDGLFVLSPDSKFNSWRMQIINRTPARKMHRTSWRSGHSASLAALGVIRESQTASGAEEPGRRCAVSLATPALRSTWRNRQQLL
ncbi:caspase family protein [Mesorhizobium sp.]|uniref:caspase family protein n=1 Tax=Mesorhizobium sp. TaxID=1871066 RepID=UPI000FE5BD6C|nr:caspase family protein [Mesorhizobium sp.]RWO89709.1 MAG: hypothetical protein EOQ95_16270 [Mesorhizobium sp.]